MANTHEIGRKAENIAAGMLESKGYKILHRNWRYYQKELDLVAMYNNMLIIVEVKSRIGHFSEPPSEAVTFGKMKHLVNAAEAYILKYDIENETRFDVVAVTFYGEDFFTEHIEGAFVAGVNW